MQAVIMLLIVPLFILNTVGGITAIVWLAVLGEWGGLGLGLGGMIGGTLVCGLLLLPGLIFAGPAAYLLDKEEFLPRTLGAIAGMLGLLWTYGLMAAWSFGAFYIFMDRADSESWIPYLLLSYGVATGPWTYMASKEHSKYSAMSAFFLQIACISWIVIYGFTGLDPIVSIIIFGIIMGIGYLVNILAGGVMLMAETKVQRQGGLVD